jgi:hypothetical protein
MTTTLVIAFTSAKSLTQSTRNWVQQRPLLYPLARLTPNHSPTWQIYLDTLKLLRRSLDLAGGAINGAKGAHKTFDPLQAAGQAGIGVEVFSGWWDDWAHLCPAD